ncbi:hypothetical protein [Tropicimonas sp. IMCC6043]|uniref:hypothetical protein n=1 Tax=Tropicimonas sp. IMCC6043 TaxID=2510645 RepID=UPI00101CEA36|nr:hypothetical protein [Tropicimonas sp. IMCC6043]RYH09155.1 hypothetical protein EU800_13165 [Tropicimonas sp. IMCC6043]
MIKLIPEVKPRLALQAFQNLIFEVAIDEYNGSLEVATEEVSGASASYIDDYGGDREVITPHGAKLLKRMFEAGMIPQKRKLSPKDLSALDAYIDSEGSIRQKAILLDEKVKAEKEEGEAAWRAIEARAAHLAEHPEDAKLEEINSTLIDRVFIAKYGYGRGGEIDLAGCRCSKVLDRYVSNSGKTRRTDPRISWIDPDGNQHGDPNPPAPNRRSDPNRNWGLGRE